jgi:hypothetical protein
MVASESVVLCHSFFASFERAVPEDNKRLKKRIFFMVFLKIIIGIFKCSILRELVINE